MKGDVHLVFSDTPLPEKVSHKAVCGAIVHRAKVAFIWDTQAMNAPLDVRPRGLCRHCYLSPPGEGSIVYGFKEGPEILPANFREEFPDET